MNGRWRVSPRTRRRLSATAEIGVMGAAALAIFEVWAGSLSRWLVTGLLALLIVNTAELIDRRREHPRQLPRVIVAVVPEPDPGPCDRCGQPLATRTVGSAGVPGRYPGGVHDQIWCPACGWPDTGWPAARAVPR